MPLPDIRAAIASTMTQWGMPDTIRVDNGWPWGRRGGVVPALDRWLIGVGVAIHWNRPHRPTENGTVERSHGVLKRWVEVATCPSYAALQTALAAAVRIQRTKYPACGGQSREAAYPALRTARRMYAPTDDMRHWDGRRVHAWLAEGMWQRIVDSSGKIAIGGASFSVGRQYARTTVTVRFAPTTGMWVIRTAHGDWIGERPALEYDLDPTISLAEVWPPAHDGPNPATDNEGIPHGG